MTQSFKLYLFDTGLLRQLSGLILKVFCKNDFSFKSALAENFVLQQIIDKFIIEQDITMKANYGN